MNIELVTLDLQFSLAHQVAKHLQKPLHIVDVIRFADGELIVSFKDYALFQDKTVIIIQSAYAPVNDFILLIAFAAHELKNAGAKKVIALVPYLGYSRQEKSAIEGKKGNLQVVVQLLERAGIDFFITVELHAPQSATFFSIPFYNIGVDELIAKHIKKHRDISSCCLVAPDKGAQKRVEQIARLLNLETVVCTKKRFAPDQTALVDCVGNYKNKKTAIIIDDIIDTGGTALHVADYLAHAGVEELYGYFVHPVLSHNAQEKIAHSVLRETVVCNTIVILEIQNGIQLLDSTDEIVRAIQIIMQQLE